MDYRTFRLAAVHEIVGSGGAFQPVVWGDLSGLPLPDLLNVLSHGKRTGLLLVRGKDASERALGLVDGHITWAGSSVTTEMDVREVCFGLVRLHHGEFVFLRGQASALPAGEAISAQEALLDSLRRLDEAVAGPGDEC